MAQTKVFVIGPCLKHVTSAGEFLKDEIMNAQFTRVINDLLKAGYGVFNSSDLGFDDSWTYEEKMDIFCYILNKCDAVFGIPGWEKADEYEEIYNFIKSKNKIYIYEIGDGEFAERDLEEDH